MKILILTQVVPSPPDSGPKIKTHNLLRYLAQHHEVHLVSFARSRAEEEQASALSRFCRQVTTVPLRRSPARDVGYLLRSLVTGRPFLIERDGSPAMHDVVAQQLRKERFDAVHADQISMAQFAVDLPVPCRVLDEHNAVWTIVRRAASREGYGPRRLLAELEWRKLRAYEGAICRRFDVTTTVSRDDDAALAAAARAPILSQVIPIAVDTQELAFRPRTSEATQIVSVATMFYPPNAEGIHWFATAVLPDIRSSAPEAQFIVVGSRPPRRIRRLASGESGVVVTGYVADLEPILRRSAVMVVPLSSGSGMRVKILEAFARGIPVVSTTIGVEGIAARPGEHLLVADDAADFARAVLRLLNDPAEAARLALAARRLVEEHYDWRSALSQLDTIYPPAAQHSGLAEPAGLATHR